MLRTLKHNHCALTRAWLTACMLLWFGCGRTVPPPNARRPTAAVHAGAAPVVATTAAPRAQAAGAASPNHAFTLGWSKQGKPFNKGLALAPSGHLGVLASRRLSLHDGATGKVVAQTDVCFTFSHALGFVDEHTAALVCETGVTLFQLPSLQYRGVRTFEQRATHASFAAGKLLVSFSAGPAQLLSTTDWSVVQRLPVAGQVTALAVSQDGTSAALGLSEGEVLLYALDGRRAPQRVEIKRGFEVSALSLSADGQRLFAAAGPVSTSMSTADPQRRKRLRLVMGVTRAEWLGTDAVVTVGEAGLLLVKVNDGSVESIDGAAGIPVGLAVAAASKVVCAARREGRVSCWSRGALPVSRRIVVGADAAGAGGHKMVGRVVAAGAGHVRVKAAPRTPLPSVGARVALLRYTEQDVGALRSARWVHLADAAVVQITKDVVRLHIVGPVRSIEGVKDPLIYDTPVALAWGQER